MAAKKPETNNECAITIRCSTRRRNKFYRECKRNAVVPSAILRRMMDDYAAGKINYNVEVSQ